MADEKLEADVTVDDLVTLISVSANVDIKIKRSLQILDRFCCGYLVGKIINQEIKVYDLVELDLSLFENVDFGTPHSVEILAEFAAIRASYPVGIDLVGMFITQPENGNLEVAEHLMRILEQLEDISYASFYTVCLIKPSTCIWHISYGEEELMQIDNIGTCNDNLLEMPLFRVQQKVVISWLKSTGDEGLQAEIDNLDSELIGSKAAYLVNTIGVVLHNDDNGLALPEMSCRDIIDELKSTLGVKQWPLHKRSLANVIDVTGLVRISTKGRSGLITEEDEETVDERPVCIVPVLLSHKLAGDSCSVIKLPIDAFVATSLDTPMHKLLYMLRDAVFRQQTAICSLLKADPLKRLYQPFHFQTSTDNLPITVMLPSCDINGTDVNEDNCLEYRKKLHDRFLMPHDRVIFRKVLSCYSGHQYESDHLVNPHEGLSEPDIEGGQLALVHGSYAYHHYMQDGFNDNVWGCAYRSLQTLASWFWLQGYTEKKYPSHREIQEALVAIGDKENTFIDSKEWIGSIEVSYCLDQIYGITSKTLHCSTGSELAYKGRDLYRHFIDEGTPIMIGGGVLAHSIVGVKYNEHTGAIKFLIVDPHFTGKDNLKTVQSKGWVGWKGPEFWNQTAHYNLCMPLRPRII